MANKRLPEHIERGLRGIDYPTLKSELLRHAARLRFDEESVELFRLLPDREYANFDDVIEHLESDTSKFGDELEDEGVELESGSVEQHVIGDGGLERGPGSIGEGGGSLPPGVEDRAGIEAMQRAGEVVDSGRAASELDLEIKEDNGGEDSEESSYEHRDRQR